MNRRSGTVITLEHGVGCDSGFADSRRQCSWRGAESLMGIPMVDIDCDYVTAAAVFVSLVLAG